MRPDAAFAAAPVSVDVTVTTPMHHHAQMEPHASMAAWHDGRLTVHTPAQLPMSARK